MLGKRAESEPDRPSVFAFTMVKNETAMLPRWLAHYGRELGHERLLVIDDASTDGSTDKLPCPVIKLNGTWRPGWTRGRRTMVCALAKSMLAGHDVVIFTDVDEFLVADPDRYTGLVDYLAWNTQPVIAPVAVNLLHDADVEPALDQTRLVTEQRSLVKFAPVMCKPSITRVAEEWSAGFHGIRHEYRIHPDLLMLHLKFSDVDELAHSSASRHGLFTESQRGHQGSSWSQEAEALAAQLREWTSPARKSRPQELDPYGLKTKRLVKQNSETGYFQAAGSQLLAMSSRPLRTLPERFRVV